MKINNLTCNGVKLCSRCKVIDLSHFTDYHVKVGTVHFVVVKLNISSASIE